MRLAKDRLDIGLITDNLDMLDFIGDDVGLGKPERLPVNKTMVQYRFDLDGSVIKINVVDELDASDQTGYRALIVANPGTTTPQMLIGPDDVSVEVVPPGHGGVGQLGVRLAVPDVGAAQRYFADALEWDVDGTTVRLGASTILLAEDSAAPSVFAARVRGWRYLTVQIHDCDAETERAVTNGAILSRDPITLGKVARFAMITDPFGNLLELSQRASLTGPLPEND